MNHSPHPAFVQLLLSAIFALAPFLFCLRDHSSCEVGWRWALYIVSGNSQLERVHPLLSPRYDITNANVIELKSDYPVPACHLGLAQ